MYFVSCSCSIVLDREIDCCYANPDKQFSFTNVSKKEVFDSVLGFKSNAVGLDEIPFKFLKVILPYIVPVITHIFNFCLTKSVFPKLWKEAKETLINV